MTLVTPRSAPPEPPRIPPVEEREEPTTKVFAGDCRDILPTLPAASVDLVVTDPPYGVTTLPWDRPVTGWMREVERVLKPSGSLWLFGSLRSLVESADEWSGWKIAQEIVWEKEGGSNFAADRFKRVHELIIQLYRGPWGDIYKAPQYTMDAFRANHKRPANRTPQTGKIGASRYVRAEGGPRLMRSVLKVQSRHGSAVHPTEKPVGIMRPLIEYGCPPGGVVLDPFAGSGSTGVAAVSVHRRAVLIEINTDYVDIIHRRTGAVQQTLPMDEAELV